MPAGRPARHRHSHTHTHPKTPKQGWTRTHAHRHMQGSVGICVHSCEHVSLLCGTHTHRGSDTHGTLHKTALCLRGPGHLGNECSVQNSLCSQRSSSGHRMAQNSRAGVAPSWQALCRLCGQVPTQRGCLLQHLKPGPASGDPLSAQNPTFRILKAQLADGQVAQAATRHFCQQNR